MKRPPLHQPLARTHTAQTRPTPPPSSRTSPTEAQRIRRESRAILEAFKAQVEGLDDDQIRQLKSAAPPIEQLRALDNKRP